MILYIANVIIKVTTIVILHLRYVVAWYPPVNDLKKMKIKRYIIPAKMFHNAKEHSVTSIMSNIDETVISMPYWYTSFASGEISANLKINVRIFTDIQHTIPLHSLLATVYNNRRRLSIGL